MQFSTNVFGPVRVLKGVLPFMRKARSGTVVNVGSIAGIDGLPCCALYAGSKFALEGVLRVFYSKVLSPAWFKFNLEGCGMDGWVWIWINSESLLTDL